VALLAAIVVSACGGSSSSTSASASSRSAASTPVTTSTPTAGQLSYEGIPLEAGPQLGSTRSQHAGTVDGISCQPTEQLVYHIHVHLAVFANGRLFSLPAGLGIPGSTVEQTSSGPVAARGHCIYWLHTHTADGIIHIESPVKRIYDLGNFFDIWHQPLTTDRVASLHGRVTALVNGQLWKRSPRAIPLLPHSTIQLDIGAPAPPVLTINWGRTSL
jgi:hypothetical protein